MNLAALQHILRTAGTLAEDRRFLVLGSAALLASFPSLGNAGEPLAATYDADLCPEPFDELTAVMLDEALGENRAYYQRHGYHADILRESILQTLPHGWRGRLVLVPDSPHARALQPCDLAAAKLAVGRPKDLRLVAWLISSRRVDAGELRARLEELPLGLEAMPRVLACFRQVTAADGRE